MKRLSPVLLVTNVKETIEFYKKLFDVEVTITVPDEETPQFAAVKNDEVEIMFQEKENMIGEYSLLRDKEIGGTFTLYMDIGEVKPIYEKCKAANCTFVNDIHQTFYGADEFAIMDNNGYILVFTKR